MRKLLALSLALCILGCSGANSKKTALELDKYEQKIKKYDCSELEDEMSYIDQNLSLLKEQANRSSFDNVMENVLSLGIPVTGKTELEQSIKSFEARRIFITNSKKTKLCNDKKN